MEDGEFETALNSNVKRKTIYNSKYDTLSFFEKKKILFNLFFRKRYLYKKYVDDNYDVEIAFLEGPITRLFSVKNNNTRKLAWVHNDITRVFGNGIKAKIKIILEEHSYKTYEKLIFVSNDNLNSFERKIKISKPKQVIYNYIDSENIINKSNEKVDIEFDPNKINIVSVSRLVEQKGIDRWIRVHSKIVKEGINQRVYIIGSGPQKEYLEELIKEEKVEDSFILLGKMLNPYPIIKMADYFALFSYYEGYGMVLEEAKILNKAILITDTAAREAVNNYEMANIFPNTEDGLYEKLKTVTNKPEMKNNIEYKNEQNIEQIIELLEE